MFKRLFLDIFLLYAFKISLDFLFIQEILPKFYYEPYLGNYGDFDLHSLLLGYMVLPFLWLSIRSILLSEQFPFSRLIIIFQFLILVLPAFTVFAQSNRPNLHLVLVLFGFYTYVITVRLVPHWKPPTLSPIFVLIFMALTLMIGIYTYSMLIFTGGLQRINFNLLNVYEVREEYVEHFFPFAGYFVPLTANVLNIFLLIYGAALQKWTLSFLAVILELFLFSMTNLKIYLFLPFVSLTLYYGLQSLRLKFSSFILFGAVSLSIFTSIATLTNHDFIISIFRRVFVTPISLTSLYFDYFSTHTYAFMSGSTIGKMISSMGFNLPYDNPPAIMIAWEYWGRESDPNVCWIGASFANFGVFGILIFGILLGIFSKTGDSIARLVKIRGVTESLSLNSSISFTNSAFLTSLFTHGGFISLIFVWMFNNFLRSSNSIEKRETPYGI